MLALILCAGALQAQESRKGQWTVGVAGGYQQMGKYSDASKEWALSESYKFGMFGEYMIGNHLVIYADVSTTTQYRMQDPSAPSDLDLSVKIPGIQCFLAAKYEWNLKNLFLDIAAGPVYRCLSKSGKQTFETSDVHVFALGVQPSIGWRFNSHWDFRLTNRWDFDVYSSDYNKDKYNFYGGFGATLGVAYTF